MNQKFLMKLIINIFALLIVSYLIPGFYFNSIWATLVTAVIMGLLNTYIRPILQILFLPLSIVTLGITAFLINVVLLWGTSYFVPGFEIQSFITAVWASLALSLISLFLNKLIKD
jgi:putative membrane protein